VAKRRQRWTREFKLAAIARLEVAPTVRGLAVELGVTHGMLLTWRRAYEAGGAEALNFPGQWEVWGFRWVRRRSVDRGRRLGMGWRRRGSG
jgi:hypothetical protein